MGDRTLMGTRSMGGGRSKSVSSMLSQRDKVRMGKQTQEQKGEGETGGNRQDKQFLSTGMQGPVTSKSTSNLYSKRQSAETTRRIINGLQNQEANTKRQRFGSAKFLHHLQGLKICLFPPVGCINKVFKRTRAEFLSTGCRGRERNQRAPGKAVHERPTWPSDVPPSTRA